ncbi:sugar transferase [Clostridium perfringens]
MKKREQTVYERYIKRVLDLIWAILAIVVFWWLYIIIAILVKIKLGSPVIFKQQRPGLNEKVFSLYKFRTMTDERDENGNLMPDEVRLTKFGKWLRSTSLDELPEVFNIINGDMSVIGPRPQLVRDMVFMTEEQRERHSVRPGLSGLAQVNGRNSISWENKLNYDLQYIKKITFLGDVKIIIQTVQKAFIKQEGISEDGMATAEDLGDYLLRTKQVEKSQYDSLQAMAKEIIKFCNN